MTYSIYAPSESDGTSPLCYEIVNWWDPLNEGLAVLGAYRAINTVGTAWLNGPASYAASLINDANPGTYDLTDPGGAVSWNQATGWEFISAATTYLETGILHSSQNMTMIVEYVNNLLTFTNMMGAKGAGDTWFILYSIDAANHPDYGNGGLVPSPQIAPGLGNLAVAGQSGYLDGSFDVAVPAGAGASGLSIRAGAVNGLGAYWDGYIESFAIYNEVLNATSIAAIATAMGQL